MKLGVAQIPSLKGDVASNIKTHINAIELAIELGISYLVFPELSLTGYEPELCKGLAFELNDRRLEPIKQLIANSELTVCVGAPLRTEALPAIGAMILPSKGQTQVYTKMHLHPGEDEYFSAGADYHFISIGDKTVANAICADTNETSHARYCLTNGASVYMAGALITKSGYDADTSALRGYSSDFNALVAMANHNAPSGGYHPCGKSAIWYQGKLIATANETDSALVIAEYNSEKWEGNIVRI